MMRTREICNEYLRLRINRACDTRKFDKRVDLWVAVDCPKDLAAAIQECTGEWPFPHLAFLVTAPALRPDGSIISTPGYDESTQIVYNPRGVAFPPVPPAPTRAQALAALDRFDSLLGTLDLVDELARSTAISAIWTALFRTAMATAPMHGITSPVPGPGKSKLVRVVAIVAVGHPVPVITLADREEETEKRIGSLLMASSPIISLDNVERPISGPFVNQALTEPLVAPRRLGTNDMVLVPNTAAYYATGNNLKFAGDVAARRTLRVRLDPHCERPELREFEAPDRVIVAREQRPELVVAALSVVRGFVAAGCPRKHPPLGSFEGWCRWVRDPLTWLGRPDPVEAMAEARRDDPILTALTAITEQMARRAWRSAGDDARTDRRGRAVGGVGQLCPPGIAGSAA